MACQRAWNVTGSREESTESWQSTFERVCHGLPETGIILYMKIMSFRSIGFVFVLMLLFVACSGPDNDSPRTPGADGAGSAALASPTPSQTEAGDDPTGEPATDASPTGEAAPTEAGQPADSSPVELTEPAEASPDSTVTTEPPPPTATMRPSPEVPSDLPAGVLPNNRVLAYYGHPSTPLMGILGEYSKEDLRDVLREEAAAYEAADPDTPVVMAFELIATVAQPDPGSDGTYVLYTGDEWIQEYVDFTAENDMLLILDVQIGHSTIRDEVARIWQWLQYPHVHLALDPEFATAPDYAPGEIIGGVDGNHINIAIEMLSELVLANKLPPKMLIVHQFDTVMIYNKEDILPLPGVDFVLDMDGWGTIEAKTGNYNHFVANELVQYGGFKLFYQQDIPVMTAEQVVSMQPPPLVVIYQ